MDEFRRLVAGEKHAAEDGAHAVGAVGGGGRHARHEEPGIDLLGVGHGLLFAHLRPHGALAADAPLGVNRVRGWFFRSSTFTTSRSWPVASMTYLARITMGSTWSRAISTAVQEITRPVTRSSRTMTSSTLMQLNTVAPAFTAWDPRVVTASTASAV